MPTNVTQPIWQCNICRTRFGTNLAAAQRCESAGVPEVMPAGELMLAYQEHKWNGREQGFFLRPLYPLPLDYATGTLASQFSDRCGHFPFYYADVDPVPYIRDGVLRWPSQWPEQKKYDGNRIWPHQPGRLNLIPGTVRARGLPHGRDLRWPAEAVGLAVADTPVKPTLDGRYVRPLTEPVAAVLAALDAEVVFAATSPAWLDGRHRWVEQAGLGAMAMEQSRTRSGEANKYRAEAWAHSRPHAAVLADLNERWRQWWAGEPISVPRPSLRCRKELHASKLNKAMKQLVAATGVEWPARTSSTEYARMLLTNALEYRMDTTEQLFDTREVIAVTGTKGGVGKSSVAAALARRVAGDGRRVALIDCDLTGPSQQVLFGLGPALTDRQRGVVLLSPTDVPGLGVFSPGQVFEPGAVEWNATTIADWMRFVGSCVALDDVDVVVLDLPPGEGTIHEIVFRSHQVTPTAVVHVTTGHPLAVADTERGLANPSGRHDASLRHQGRAVLVENLSRARGQTVGGVTVEIRLLGAAGAVQALAERHNLRYGGSMPWCPEVADMAGSDEVAELAAMVAPVAAEAGVARG